MGFLSNIFSAAVKTVTLPLAAVEDVSDTFEGEHRGKTKEVAKEVVDDTASAVKDLFDLDLF